MSETPHPARGEAGEERPALTYGELRRRLEQMGNPWTVDPLISDDEPVPQFPMGGEQADSEDILRLATRIDPQADIRELIAMLPPNDPGLRELWNETGLPLDREVSEATSDRLPVPSAPESPQPRTEPKDDGGDTK
ncbi:hypothetical protein ACX80V_16990 [Arthrobacter sp. MDT3-24]